MKLKKIFVLALIGFSIQAHALEIFDYEIKTSNWRFQLGNRTSDSKMNEDASFSYEYEKMNNLHAGVVRDYYISDDWAVRHGLFVDQRSGAAKIDNNVDVKEFSFSSTFIHMPIQLVRKVEDYGFLFAGPSFGFRAVNTCTYEGAACSLTGEKPLILPIQVGAEISIMNKINFGVYYETAPGKYSDEFYLNGGFGIFLITTPTMFDEDAPIPVKK